METKTPTVSIRVALEVLCIRLLFTHAMSGCDTTSAFYGIGKVKHMKSLQSSQTSRSDVLLFGDSDATHQQLLHVGEQFVAVLYRGVAKTPKSLDELRYLHVISSKYVAMPPTSRACYFHRVLVHHQVSIWHNLRTVFNKEDYGFKLESGAVTPIITDMVPSSTTRCAA